MLRITYVDDFGQKHLFITDSFDDLNFLKRRFDEVSYVIDKNI